MLAADWNRWRAAIDEDRLARTLVDLIAIPSVNPFGAADLGAGQGELAAAHHVADQLNQLGWSCEITEFAPGRANVIGRAPRRSGDDRKAIVLAGHLDTVEVAGYDRPFDARLSHGRIHGRGACDMKAAIACYLEVARVVAASGIELAGDLVIAGVADEEYRQQGARAARPALPQTALVVIGEPTELRICTAAKGLAAYTLAVEGKATHGSVPQAGSNAILGAAELLPPIVQHATTLTHSPHPLLGPGVLNVGVIRGGLKPNIVPSHCEVEISRRLLPGETPAAARDLLLNELRQTRCKHAWRLSEAWWEVAPYENADTQVVAAFQRSAHAAGIHDCSIHGFPASSDAAYFGAPVVIFGPGSLDQAHSLDEWVTLEEMVLATATYLRFAIEQLAPQEIRA